MADDLILETGEGEDEYDYFDYDPHAEISSAYNALNAVADLDDKMGSKERAKMINEIKIKCLEIIHKNIKEIHADVFARLIIE